MRDLYIASDEIVVSLDPSEIRLIDRALHCLRYSNDQMTGSQLVNLAGLSGEWMALTQDHAAKRYHDPYKIDKGPISRTAFINSLFQLTGVPIPESGEKRQHETD